MLLCIHALQIISGNKLCKPRSKKMDYKTKNKSFKKMFPIKFILVFKN